MSNAARVDELWDQSLPSGSPEPFLQTNRALRAVLNTTHAPIRASEPAEFEFLGERILWTRDGNRGFPVQVANVLDQIAEFAALPLGWDSYNGRATAQSAVRPALQLIFEADRNKCQHPRAVPLSGGGIGLRWRTERYDLEIDIWSAAEVEGLLVDRQSEEEVEVPLSAMDNVRPLLDRFLLNP